MREVRAYEAATSELLAEKINRDVAAAKGGLVIHSVALDSISNTSGGFSVGPITTRVTTQALVVYEVHQLPYTGPFGGPDRQ